MPHSNGETFVVVCDVNGETLADDDTATAHAGLVAAVQRLAVERIALPVLPPPGPQRVVSLETAEQHITQVDRLLLALQRVGDPQHLFCFGPAEHFVPHVSRVPALGDPAATAALLAKLSVAIETLANVRIGDDSAALSTVSARHFEGADLADFGRDFDRVVAQRGSLVDDIMAGRAIATSAHHAICRAVPRRSGLRRPAQNMLAQHLRAVVPGAHTRTRTRLAFHALQSIDACLREHVHTVCGAGGDGTASALEKATRAFEMRYFVVYCVFCIYRFCCLMCFKPPRLCCGVMCRALAFLSASRESCVSSRLRAACFRGRSGGLQAAGVPACRKTLSVQTACYIHTATGIWNATDVDMLIQAVVCEKSDLRQSDARRSLLTDAHWARTSACAVDRRGRERADLHHTCRALAARRAAVAVAAPTGASIRATAHVWLYLTRTAGASGRTLTCRFSGACIFCT